MGAPRLVEYWEQDPCHPAYPEEAKLGMAGGRPGMARPTPTAASMGVKIEAQFTVGEYQIVILSAKDSSGLDTWLRSEKYNIPAGAEPLLRPYVEAGSKFFVAKVDPQKVKFEDGRAALSPLRFYYDTDQFELPIRLGLANSQGTQDLIVNILSKDRYQVANYPNITIPTNIDLNEGMKDKFAGFYAALFDATLEKHPGSVVTEYAWAAGSCDPCPGPTLTQQELMTLGADVTASKQTYNLTLTRLHARYGKDITNDLVFKAADPIVGGRELRGANGQLETGAQPSSSNNFQGRYAIRHPWTGPLTCDKPIRNVWGGPPAGTPSEPVKPALGLAFAPRGSVQLVNAFAHPEPQIDLGSAAFPPLTPSGSAAGSGVAAPAPPTDAPKPKKKSGCGCEADGRNEIGTAAFLIGIGLITLRRRRQS